MDAVHTAAGRWSALAAHEVVMLAVDQRPAVGPTLNA
jgi:hypothetical protein